MAIEILKRGEVPEDRPYTLHCNHCKSELRFMKADAEYVSDPRDGDYLKIDCPVCGDMVTTAVKANKQ